MLHPAERQASVAASSAGLDVKEARAERVARLGRAARAGAYHPDARAVAAALLARIEAAASGASGLPGG